MIDMIFVVNNSKQWHAQNLQSNSEHYSTMMRHSGSSCVTSLQRNYGARIYYNTLVELRNSDAEKQQLEATSVAPQLYKYGVIEQEDFERDLTTWETLYCSGRLHKPVLSIYNEEEQEKAEQSTINKQLQQAQQTNLIHAVNCARLLLPEKFSEHDFYMKITALSYMGDIRMKVGGENSNKVSNIVKGNFEHFQALYRPLLSASFGNTMQVNSSDNTVEQLSTVDEHKRIVTILPENLKSKMQQLFSSGSNNKKQSPSTQNMKSWHEAAVETGEHKKLVEQALAAIIAKSSTSQTIKGALTAGLRKSYIYAMEKLKKGRKK